MRPSWKITGLRNWGLGKTDLVIKVIKPEVNIRPELILKTTCTPSNSKYWFMKFAANPEINSESRIDNLPIV